MMPPVTASEAGIAQNENPRSKQVFGIVS